MAEAHSGGVRLLYGVIIRDRCKTADPDTLRAYKKVAEDLLKHPNAGGGDKQELQDSIKEIDKALGGKK